MSRLIDEINKYKEAFKQKATKKLEDASLSKNALTVGSTAKEIKLPNALGNEVSLFKTLEHIGHSITIYYPSIPNNQYIHSITFIFLI